MHTILDFINHAPLFGFIFASVILILAPGPDIIFLITQSIQHGRKAGLATAVGLSLGNLFHTILAATGVSLVLLNSQQSFNIIKVLGAFYLLWLAAQSLRTIDNDSTPTRQANLFRQGLIMNMLNPKVALFFIAFLPQFVVAEGLPSNQQMLLLGGVFTTLVLIIFCSVGVCAQQLHVLCSNQLRASMLLRGLVASLYTLIAMQLFF